METIAAISTPIGYGGIGIVRISGEKALNIAQNIFKSKKNLEPNTIIYGKIYDNNEIVDEVLISYFKAPFSYTGEDIIEINSHGGILIVRKILELVLKNGARLAEPGEFTKRAFINGKLDLTQAEAVIDLINSKTSKENKISVKQLEGDLGKELSTIKEQIVDCLVDIEANVDYPEYDVEETNKTKIKKVIDEAMSKLSILSKSFDNGKFIKNGIKTAIIGKPNVGKSSLLNALLNEERAIVTDIAGTTRDTIEESIIIDGILFNIIDTAGIRNTSDKVEEIGVNKSIKLIDEADLVIMMLDNHQEMTDEDLELLKAIQTKKSIIVLNKIDLVGDLERYLYKIDVLKMSIKDNIGIDKLKEKMIELFNTNEISVDDSLIITNSRHKEAIDKTLVSLQNIKNSINNVPLDMISIDLQNAIKNIGEILGDNVSEDVINGIFKKFCLGK